MCVLSRRQCTCTCSAHVQRSAYVQCACSAHAYAMHMCNAVHANQPRCATAPPALGRLPTATCRPPSVLGSPRIASLPSRQAEPPGSSTSADRAGGGLPALSRGGPRRALRKVDGSICHGGGAGAQVRAAAAALLLPRSTTARSEPKCPRSQQPAGPTRLVGWGVW